MAITYRTREDAARHGPAMLKAWDEHAAIPRKESVKVASGKGLLGQSSAELRFETRYLEPALEARKIIAYTFVGKSRAAHSFHVAGTMRYTPDYEVRIYDDIGVVRVYVEVKGNYHGASKRSQVIRGRYRDSLTRLQVVAEREGSVFLLAEYRGREGWKITRIPGAGDGIDIRGLFGVTA